TGWLQEQLATVGAIATSAPRAIPAAEAEPVRPPLAPAPEHAAFQLWYRQPAQHWTEALPIGNGRLGAMIFGGPGDERIQLNDDTLWTGRPHAYHHEGAVAHLATLRRLLSEGRQAEAEKLAQQEFMSVPLRQEAYQPLGDILLAFPGHDQVHEYRRELDLQNGWVQVGYRTGDGARFSRRAFASHPDRVIVQRIQSDRAGAVAFTLRAASPHAAAQARPVDHQTWLLEGRVQFTGTRFASAVRVLVDGPTARVQTTETGIEVTGADAATVLIAAATSFVSYRDVSGAPNPAALNHLDAATPRDFHELEQRHVSDHRRLFDRVQFTLGSGDAPSFDEPTDERLRRSDASLVSQLFHYGRYLLIASSRRDDQPANLQGNWNEAVNPPWGSKYTVNINTEMNYWPAEVANLPECAEPLFRLIEEVAVSGRETARAHYGARGWVLHHNTDLWRGTAPINASNHGIWPTGGAWLCQHLWERWRFGGDREVLERAYPLFRDAALFFVDFLVEDPKTGWLISGPSNSPENGGLVMGPTMDHQIIRSLFGWTAEAARELQRDGEFAAQLEELRARIAPNQVGQHGQLQEWLEDLDDPKNQHRHVSHLWGLYPGEEITPDTPALFDAARQSLRFRGDEGTGWSLGWKIAFWARLRDGDHAYRMIQQQLRPVDGARVGVRVSS
ncbi:MAG TPA: glycoside hydrolase family 95 protein, partial [Candidatus Synoicihabitans sp.]|nr:glycoside hydrolase family 95 protein [Candidatus Synoicihabitans sp.]